MGNKTVTPAPPATSRTPFVTTIPISPRTSFYVNNPDIFTAPPKPPTFLFRSNSSTSAVPVASAPAFSMFPVTSTTVDISSVSTSPVVSTTVDIPAVPTTPATSPVVNIPAVPTIPVTSPTFSFPVVSPNLPIPIIPPTDAIPVVPASLAIRVVSPSLSLPAVSSTPGIPLVSSTPNINDIPVFSPDTSVVSPTTDIPVTPIASPTFSVDVIPVNPTNSVTEIHPAAPITNEPSASPTIPVVPTTPVISTTPLPTKVAPQRSISKISITPSTLTREPTKPTTLSPVERWNKYEQKQREKHERSFQTTEQARSLDRFTPSLTNIKDDQSIIATIPDIVAVPSFSLRSTAVCNPPQDNYLLSERTQSIHADISIFKYYLTYKEAKQTIGNHTKATMFKMDTRLKKTPLPTPSLSFLTRNFNDGTHETDGNLTAAPTFGSLGLQNDSEIEFVDESSTKFDVDEKQQQKIPWSSPHSDMNSGSTSSLQFVSSAVISQPNFSLIEKPSVRNNHQPVTSILKKPVSPVNNNNNNNNRFPTKTNNKVFQKVQKNAFEKNPSTVSSKTPLSPSKKPNQNTLKNEKFSSKRLSHRKK